MANTNNSGVSAREQSVKVQITPNTRTWVKPALERLSLKDALTGAGCNVEGCTFGS